MSGRIDTRALGALQDIATGMVERRTEQQRHAIVAQVESDFPGVHAHVEGDMVVLTGRHLLDRWIRDARLRDVGRDVLRQGGGRCHECRKRSARGDHRTIAGDAAIGALINRVYDGVPAKSSTPTIAVSECSGSDWGSKDHDGRELRLGITISDQTETATRIGQIMPLVEAAVRRVGIALVGNWSIGSVVLVRSRIVPQSDGRWSAIMDYRLRALSTV